MPATALIPPLMWHGGKTYLARRLLALMPSHLHYCEPYFGGGALLMSKDPTNVSECINDLDGRLTNFWKVLQDPANFARFKRVIEATPFSETEWRDAGVRLDDPNPVIRATAFFVRCRQSLAGRMDSFAPLSRTRARRQMNEQMSAWATAIAGLPAVHERLGRVVILNRDALDVIRQQDGPSTLFYCDPPYLPDTRTAPAVYRHEMTAEQHRALLETVRGCQGKVMLSGYASDLYSNMLFDWHRTTFDVPNNSAGGRTKRRMAECIWCNF